MRWKNRVAALLVSVLAGVAGSTWASEWNGTMSCGELKNSPNAKSISPYTGAVTLRIDGNKAVFERNWAKGKEHLEGQLLRGQPLRVDGQGWFFDKPGNPWKTSATLTHSDRRYEGTATLTSVDGKTKYRDCTVSLETTAPPEKQSPAVRQQKAVQPTPDPVRKTEPPKPAPSTQPTDKPAISQAAAVPTAAVASAAISASAPRDEAASPGSTAAASAMQTEPLAPPVAASAPAALPASSPNEAAAPTPAGATAALPASAADAGSSASTSGWLVTLGGVVIGLLAFLGYRRLRPSRAPDDVRANGKGLPSAVKYGAGILVAALLLGFVWNHRIRAGSGATEPAPAAHADNGTLAIPLPLILSCPMSKGTASRYFFLSDGVLLEQAFLSSEEKFIPFMWMTGMYVRTPDSFEVHRTASYSIADYVLRETQLRAHMAANPPTQWEAMKNRVDISYKIVLASNQKATLTIAKLTNNGASQIKSIDSYDCSNGSDDPEAKKQAESIRASVPVRYRRPEQEPAGSSVAGVPAKSGETGRTVEGLASNKQATYYSFSAQSGATIRLTLESEGNVVAFHLYPPGAAALIAQNVVPPNRITSEPVRRFEQRATDSGTYVVGVGFPRGEQTESAKFRLSLSSDDAKIGNLTAGLVEAAPTVRSQGATARSDSSGCAQVSSMTGGASDITAKEALMQLVPARDRAMESITRAESRSDLCRASARSVEQLVRDADASLENQRPGIEYRISHGQSVHPAIFIQICQRYAQVERLLAHCR